VTDAEKAEDHAFVHTVAVVVPVYRGELTLRPLLAELQDLAHPTLSPGRRMLEVVEVVLVHDHGPDRSDVVMRDLAAAFPLVRPVWLSRNFGQHAATLAGIASTSTAWVVTLDEDGQFNPADIPRLLDAALDAQVPLVYGDATNTPPHGVVRNVASSVSRWLATSVLTSQELGRYSSFRLITGELGRAVAAYGGHDIYLDVALSWVVPTSGTCPVELRHEHDRPSGYSLASLLSHFVRLVVTSGTRPLRIVAVSGVIASILGVLLSLYLIYARIVRDITVEGWTSVAVTVLVLSGAMLFALGVIAEYIGVAVRMAMGRPPYLIVRDPQDGPLSHAEPLAVGETGSVPPARDP
jgi:undecaprenyl-phosphate 4-deoxy-4-formamido-L-arabinose transferase